MKFIDLHCDTLVVAYRNKKEDIFDTPETMIDIKRMKNSGALVQFFAIFFPPEVGFFERFGVEYNNDEAFFENIHKIYRTTLEKHGDYIKHANNVVDILNNESKGLMSSFLTFEDGRIINSDFDNLDKYFKKGVRLISLTWNFENCFGYPNSSDPEKMKLGLKDFGKGAIEYMNELGIIIDVSHLSDGGFMDVANISKKPFVASHSNCRSIIPHQRNLTDEMIKIIGEKGGVIGLNYAPDFLNEDIKVRESTIELLKLHINKLINIGGEDCIALGSDFDGITGNLEISDVTKVQNLFNALKNDGIPERVIEKFAYCNAERVIKDVMK